MKCKHSHIVKLINTCDQVGWLGFMAYQHLYVI